MMLWRGFLGKGWMPGGAKFPKFRRLIFLRVLRWHFELVVWLVPWWSFVIDIIEFLVSNPTHLAGLEIAAFWSATLSSPPDQNLHHSPKNLIRRCGSKKGFASQDLRIRVPIPRSGSETVSWGSKSDPQVEIRVCITAIILYNPQVRMKNSHFKSDSNWFTPPLDFLKVRIRTMFCYLLWILL